MFARFTFWGYASKISSEVDGVFTLYVIKWTGFLQFNEKICKDTSYGKPKVSL